MCAPGPSARAAARGAPAPGLPALLFLLLVAAPTGRAVPCVSGDLPKPTNVAFISINMKNILQWNPPEGLQGMEVSYTVQYFIYGQKKWLNKSECRNISRTYCDLSAETSDYEHQYYAKVKAMWGTNCSKWAETGRFYPFLETQIGPPEVALTTDEKSISIVLTAPKKWKKNPEESSISMQQIYSNLKYNVSIYNTKSNRTWSQCVTNHTLVFSWLEPGTLYCVFVESFVPGPPRLTHPSERQCVSTLEGQQDLEESYCHSQHIPPQPPPTRIPTLQTYQKAWPTVSDGSICYIEDDTICSSPLPNIWKRLSQMRDVETWSSLMGSSQEGFIWFAVL